MRRGKIPDAVLMRMAGYLRLLLSFPEEQGMITSAQLGRLAGLDAARVRNDFHYFGEFGMQGRGYGKAELKACLEQVLGLDRECGVLLLGSDPIGMLMLKGDLDTASQWKVWTEPDLCFGTAG